MHKGKDNKNSLQRVPKAGSNQNKMSRANVARLKQNSYKWSKTKMVMADQTWQDHSRPKPDQSRPDLTRVEQTKSDLGRVEGQWLFTATRHKFAIAKLKKKKNKIQILKIWKKKWGNQKLLATTNVFLAAAKTGKFLESRDFRCSEEDPRYSEFLK